MDDPIVVSARDGATSMLVRRLRRRGLASLLAVLALACGPGAQDGEDGAVDEMDAGHDDGGAGSHDGGADSAREPDDGGDRRDAAPIVDAGPLLDGGDSGADAGIDGDPDAAIDAGIGDEIDAGADASVDLCASVICPGSACRAASCDPRSGECALGAPRTDGTPCDDGSLCTRLDACVGGVCTGGDPVICPPEDPCHTSGHCHPDTGLCSSELRPCTTGVLVRVRDARGAILPGATIVRAFVGTTAQPQGGATDAGGELRLLLPAGSYRFRAQRAGLPFWSGATDHCTTPGCTLVEIRVPDTTPDRAVSWDPLVDGTYDGHGEIGAGDAHIQRAGTYLENWGIEQYGRTDAFISGGHTHIYPQAWDPPDAYGNPTEYENQHAFGDILQGLFVRLDDHGRFDLVSIDYRTREDSDPEHVLTIPGADPANVEIWISTTLTIPTTPFRRYSTGMRFNTAMSSWGALFPTDVTDVTGVFITTTGNVSIDNVVVRPR